MREENIIKLKEIFYELVEIEMKNEYWNWVYGVYYFKVGVDLCIVKRWFFLNYDGESIISVIIDV